VNAWKNEWNAKPPPENKKQIPPHCPQDSNLKFQASGKIEKIQGI
jgi:hypothetical protein